MFRHWPIINIPLFLDMNILGVFNEIFWLNTELEVFVDPDQNDRIEYHLKKERGDFV